MYRFLALLLALPGLALAQGSTAPAISQQNMQALTEILSSPAAQSLMATQLGAISGNTAGAAPAQQANPAALLGGANLAGMATILQNFTPQEIAAMQRFALSPEGQSIARKLPAVIQQLQSQSAH
jgi:hypothetical protein